MKAIVQHRYGSADVLQLADVDKPRIDDDGVLVRVVASSVNAYDWHVMRGAPYLVRLSEGLRRPTSPTRGLDVAGEVEAVGRNVTALRRGDRVFGARSGAFAEYVAGRERNFVPMPDTLTFEQAAAIPTAATTALQAIRDKGNFAPGQHVLINGAGGGVGSFAVQIAKALGGHVTAVTRASGLEVARSLGADVVLDRSRHDFTRGGVRYDLIVDMSGDRSLVSCRRALKPEGSLVVVGSVGRGVLLRPVAAALLSRLGKQRFAPFLASHSRENLVTLSGFAEAGKLTAVIDRTYALPHVPDAIRDLEAGGVRGKIVIAVAGPRQPDADRT